MNFIKKATIIGSSTVVGLTAVVVPVVVVTTKSSKGESKELAITFNSENSKKPLIATAHNGSIELAMKNFDAEKMDVTTSAGTWDAATNTITGLGSGEQVTVTVTLKDGQKWVDGSDSPKTKTFDFTAPTQESTGLTKPTIIENRALSQKPNTDSSADGVIGLTLTGFDEATMNIAIESQDATNKNVELSADRTKILKLKNTTPVKVTISLKDGFAWNDGAEGSKDVVEKIFNGPPLQTYHGIAKPTISAGSPTLNIKPVTASFANGQLGVTLHGFDAIKMNIALTAGTWNGTNSIAGLKSGEETTMTISLKNANDKWTDGTTNPIVKKFTGLIQTKQGLDKNVTIAADTSKDVKPKSIISKDGKVGVTLTHYDSTKMDITTSVGAWDAAHNQITGLSNGQAVTLSIIPKPGECWKDGTRTPITKTFHALTTTSIPFATIARDMTKDTNTQIGFTFTNIDLTKMTVSFYDLSRFWINQIARNPSHYNGNSERPVSSASIASGLLGAGDSSFTKSHIATIDARSNFVTFKVVLKPGQTWEDGSTRELWFQLNKNPNRPAKEV